MTDIPRGVRVMAIFRWFLVAAMAGLATLSVAYSVGALPSGGGSAEVTYYCPMHPQVVQNVPGECPICSMTLVKREGGQKPDDKPKPKATAAEKAKAKPKPDSASHAGHRHEASDRFICPMHPEETGVDASARCPICGMKMVERSSVPAAAAGPTSPAPTSAPATTDRSVPGLVPVDLSLDRLQLIGVRTAKATVEALVPELATVGYVAADEARIARVHSRFPGWVERIAVASTGQKVRRGEVLASLYNLELVPAQQEFLAARRANPGGASAGSSASTANTGVAGLERDARTRLELFGMSKGEIDGVATSGKPARTVAVTAPIGGHVLERSAVLGSYVEPGTELFEIADLSRLWVTADIYEHEIGRVRVGQQATVTIAAYPKEQWVAKVGFLYPTVEPTTRTLRVRLEVDNADGRLRPGMFANVTLALDPAKGVVIPAEALIDTGEHRYVFVSTAPGHFEPRSIRAGARAAGRVEILEGVADGETVVTTAGFLIDSESRLQAALAGR